MSDVEEAKAGQFLLGVIQHLAKGPIGLEDPKIRAAQHDADRALFKSIAESLLALPQRFLGALETFGQNGRFAGALPGAASLQPQIDRCDQDKRDNERQEDPPVRWHSMELEIVRIARGQMVAGVKWRLLAKLTGDAHDFCRAALPHPRDELRVGEKALGDQNRDFARTIAQDEAALLFEEVGRRGQLSRHAHELAGATLAQQVRREHIAGLGQRPRAQGTDLHQHQLLHSVALGQFPARLDEVAAFEATLQKRRVARKQHNAAGAVLQVDQRRILGAGRSITLYIDRIGNQNAGDRESFTEAIRNPIAVLVAKDFLKRDDFFRGLQGRNEEGNDGETHKNPAPPELPFLAKRLPPQPAGGHGQAIERVPQT